MAENTNDSTERPRATKWHMLAELAVIVLVTWASAKLSLQWGLAGWLSIALFEWLQSRFAVLRTHWLSLIKLCWPIGLGIRTALEVPHLVLGIPAGIGVWTISVLALEAFERRIGLQPRTVESEPAVQNAERPARAVHDGPRGGSAWGGDEPVQTPENEPVRVICAEEIAMGGPIVCDFLFPDGIVLLNGGASARFSRDGRYFVSPMPSRGTWGLYVFDRRERVLYHCRESRFWELDEVSETDVKGRVSPLTHDQPSVVPLAELIATARPERFVAVQDLWLQESLVEDLAKRHAHEEPPPGPPGSPVVECRHWLPESLRTLDDPLALLRRPQGDIFVDGVATGLKVFSKTLTIDWCGGGPTFICTAMAADDHATRRRQWSTEHGFTLIDDTASPVSPQP
ncbi:hypothetical protein [Paraburkholderia fungorum]|uniref:hypothetical protein n=1 Tax=Paraburkholderia fungorum TaxID=134537 RepID=UPI0015B6245A|nr:hypothetical protein [Paraburkholderia fungorum]QLD50470.1 hypothetical protein C9419_16590 [Paraburkholderia fungorum]